MGQSSVRFHTRYGLARVFKLVLFAIMLLLAAGPGIT
jgi:putative copper export protein